MTFGSLFSGVGMFDLALENCGMNLLWQVEIDRQCRRVLTHHWPLMKHRYEDIKNVKRLRTVDLVCGGWPCQDLSVAGSRAGLSGERSGLFHELIRIVGEVRPSWVLGENVPGLLSSWTPVGETHKSLAVECGRERRMDVEEGSDLAEVIAALVRIGYGVAWRVLDARYFDLAQRRERVFFVGCLGDVRRAGQVLFEPESVSWDSSPRVRKEQAVAATIRSRSSSRGVGKPGRGGEDDENLVSYCLNGKAGKRFDGESETFVTSPITAGYKKGAGVNDGKKGSPQNLISTHSLRSEGADASEVKPDDVVDALHRTTGNKEPLVVPLDMRQTSRGAKMTNNRSRESGGAPGTGIGEVGEPSPSIAASHTPAVFSFTDLRGRKNDVVSGDMSGALHAAKGQSEVQAVAYSGGVRRLTPKECLRLMGMPDDWLDIDPPLSDSAKYRMIGNGVARPVIEWIGHRILKSDCSAMASF